MPYGNGTGPDGFGPMTGRLMGHCAGYPQPGYMSAGPGMGRGQGRGFGRCRGMGFGSGMGYGCGRGGESGEGRGMGFGRGRGFRGYNNPETLCNEQPYTEPTPEEEKNFLEKTLESLESEVKAVKDRFKKLSEKT